MNILLKEYGDLLKMDDVKCEFLRCVQHDISSPCSSEISTNFVSRVMISTKLLESDP